MRGPGYDVLRVMNVTESQFTKDQAGAEKRDERRYLLFAQHSGRFRLAEEGRVETRELESISQAVAYVRSLPDNSGAVLEVFDRAGKEMSSLVV